MAETPQFPAVENGEGGRPLGYWKAETIDLGQLKGVEDLTPYANVTISHGEREGTYDVTRSVAVMTYHAYTDEELAEREELSKRYAGQGKASNTLESFPSTFIDNPTDASTDDFRVAWSQGAKAMRMIIGRMTDISDEDATAVSGVVPPWRPGEAVEKGVLRSFGGSLYRCVQAHTTQQVWEPGETTASLWDKVEFDAGVEVWEAPSGEYNAYNVGDKVSHDGHTWESLINGNCTEPGSDDRWWKQL